MAEGVRTDMKASEVLKALAKGVNPDTGEVLEESSLAHSSQAIRLLFSLADEIDVTNRNSTSPKKPKLTPEQKRQQNIQEGKPPRSHFPWDEQEAKELSEEFRQGGELKNLAEKFERSELSILAKLEKLGLIQREELDAYQVEPQDKIPLGETIKLSEK